MSFCTPRALLAVCRNPSLSLDGYSYYLLLPPFSSFLNILIPGGQAGQSRLERNQFDETNLLQPPAAPPPRLTKSLNFAPAQLSLQFPATRLYCWFGLFYKFIAPESGTASRVRPSNPAPPAVNSSGSPGSSFTDSTPGKFPDLDLLSWLINFLVAATDTLIRSTAHKTTRLNPILNHLILLSSEARPRCID